MSDLRCLMGKQVKLEISGNNVCIGTMVDLGLDILVLYEYENRRFYYVPLEHVQHLTEVLYLDEPVVTPSDLPLDVTDISVRKTLNQAKGHFKEIYVTGNKTIHGYLTSIMNDYFVFHSPVFKTMFISLAHLKWLVPYYLHETPYTLNSQSFPVNPVQMPLSRTFEEQCKRLEGKLVVFDQGDDTNKIGLLENVKNNGVELITAKGERVYWNLKHLKTVHLP